MIENKQASISCPPSWSRKKKGIRGDSNFYKHTAPQAGIIAHDRY
jgi:hypothetical protein